MWFGSRTVISNEKQDSVAHAAVHPINVAEGNPIINYYDLISYQPFELNQNQRKHWSIITNFSRFGLIDWNLFVSAI